jgi:hypothetical protein
LGWDVPGRLIISGYENSGSFYLSTFALMACAIASAQTDYLKPEGLSPANSYSHVIVAKPGMVFIAIRWRTTMKESRLEKAI